MSKNRNILNVNKLSLRAVSKNKRKTNNIKYQRQPDAIVKYLDPLPLSPEEQEIIDSICDNNDVFYSPRKRTVIEFNDDIPKWQALGFGSDNEYSLWKQLNNVHEDSVSNYGDLAELILKSKQGGYNE